MSRRVERGPWDTWCLYPVLIEAVSGHGFSEHLGLLVAIGHPFVDGRLPVEGWLCTLGLAWENIASASLCYF